MADGDKTDDTIPAQPLKPSPVPAAKSDQDKAAMSSKVEQLKSGGAQLLGGAGAASDGPATVSATDEAPKEPPKCEVCGDDPAKRVNVEAPLLDDEGEHVHVADDKGVLIPQMQSVPCCTLAEVEVEPVRTVEEWGTDAKLLPRWFPRSRKIQLGGVLQDVEQSPAPNAEYWRFAAAQAMFAWPEGRTMTKKEFDAAIDAACNTRHG